MKHGILIFSYSFVKLHIQTNVAITTIGQNMGSRWLESSAIRALHLHLPTCVWRHEDTGWGNIWQLKISNCIKQLHNYKHVASFAEVESSIAGQDWAGMKRWDWRQTKERFYEKETKQKKHKLSHTPTNKHVQPLPIIQRWIELTMETELLGWADLNP